MFVCFLIPSNKYFPTFFLFISVFVFLLLAFLSLLICLCSVAVQWPSIHLYCLFSSAWWLALQYVFFRHTLVYMLWGESCLMIIIWVDNLGPEDQFLCLWILLFIILMASASIKNLISSPLSTFRLFSVFHFYRWHFDQHFSNLYLGSFIIFSLD